jgi:hypothetical protein
MGLNRRWRREWDSNPRYGCPYTRFPSERLQPLGHPSAAQRAASIPPWGETDANIDAAIPSASGLGPPHATVAKPQSLCIVARAVKR